VGIKAKADGKNGSLFINIRMKIPTLAFPVLCGFTFRGPLSDVDNEKVLIAI